MITGKDRLNRPAGSQSTAERQPTTPVQPAAQTETRQGQREAPRQQPAAPVVEVPRPPADRFQGLNQGVTTVRHLVEERSIRDYQDHFISIKDRDLLATLPEDEQRFRRPEITEELERTNKEISINEALENQLNLLENYSHNIERIERERANLVAELDDAHKATQRAVSRHLRRETVEDLRLDEQRLRDRLESFESQNIPAELLGRSPIPEGEDPDSKVAQAYTQSITPHIDHLRKAMADLRMQRPTDEEYAYMRGAAPQAAPRPDVAAQPEPTPEPDVVIEPTVDQDIVIEPTPEPDMPPVIAQDSDAFNLMVQNDQRKSVEEVQSLIDNALSADPRPENVANQAERLRRRLANNQTQEPRRGPLLQRIEKLQRDYQNAVTLVESINLADTSTYPANDFGVARAREAANLIIINLEHNSHRTEPEQHLWEKANALKEKLA